jgi:hypothetical protein
LLLNLVLNGTHAGYWTTVWIDLVLNETYAGYWTTITCYSTVLNGTFAGYWITVYRLFRSSTKLMPAIGPQSLVTQPGPQRNSCRLLDYSIDWSCPHRNLCRLLDHIHLFFSALSDSIPTNFTGPRQFFFSLIGLDTNKQMNASMNASMNAVPGEREKCSVRCSRV